MEQLLDVLLDIKSVLVDINFNVECLTGSVNDVKEAIDELKGDALYNNISDVCNKLDNIETEIQNVDLSVQAISSNGVYTIQDICIKLDSIDVNTYNP